MVRLKENLLLDKQQDKQFKNNMEKYQQSVELCIHSFQAQPLFAGCMLKYNKIPPNALTTIKENKAKVLLRWLLLEVVAFAMIIRIPYIIFMNPTNEKLNSSEKINMYLTIFTFLCFITTAERYRNLGCSPEKISSFVNGLFVMKTKYFGGLFGNLNLLLSFPIEFRSNVIV